MPSKEGIENILNKCDNCNLSECINCEMSYTERQKVKKYIEQLESDNYEQNNIINSYIEREQKLIEKLEENAELKEKEYKKILNSIDRKVSHTKDEHKIRSAYAEFGVKKGEMDAYKEIKQFLNKVVVKNERK